MANGDEVLRCVQDDMKLLWCFHEKIICGQASAIGQRRREERAPIPWDSEVTKKAARLRKALMAGLHSPDVDNFDIVKVVKRLKKRR